LLAILASLTATLLGFAADYPTKPVQIINQAAPGSGTDMLGCIVGPASKRPVSPLSEVQS